MRSLEGTNSHLASSYDIIVTEQVPCVTVSIDAQVNVLAAQRPHPCPARYRLPELF